MVALLFFAGLAAVSTLALAVLYDLGMDHNAPAPSAGTPALVVTKDPDRKV